MNDKEAKRLRRWARDIASEKGWPVRESFYARRRGVGSHIATMQVNDPESFRGKYLALKRGEYV